MTFIIKAFFFSLSILLSISSFAYPKDNNLDTLKCGQIDYKIPRLVYNLPDMHLHILAIGSSSTAGTGAGSKENAYTRKASLYLNQKKVLPKITITARGIGGERATGAVKRLEETIQETKPNLVIWQVGTNDALGRIPVNTLMETINNGLEIINRHRLPVILIDPQFFPKISKNELYSDTIALLSDLADKKQVPLVRRFDRMKSAFSNEMLMQALLAKDKFHMSALGHDCLALDLATVLQKSLKAEYEVTKHRTTE